MNVIRSTGVATSFTTGINRQIRTSIDTFMGLQHDCEALLGPRHPDYLMPVRMKALTAEQSGAHSEIRSVHISLSWEWNPPARTSQTVARCKAYWCCSLSSPIESCSILFPSCGIIFICPSSLFAIKAHRFFLDVQKLVRVIVKP